MTRLRKRATLVFSCSIRRTTRISGTTTTSDCVWLSSASILRLSRFFSSGPDEVARPLFYVIMQNPFRVLVKLLVVVLVNVVGGLAQAPKATLVEPNFEFGKV